MTVDGRSKSVALQKAFARRSKAFGRFAVWEAAHPVRHLPADAVSAATWLYDLLPRESRASRPSVTTRGMATTTCRLKVIVEPRSREVFAYQPQIVQGNRTAVPAP